MLIVCLWCRRLLSCARAIGSRSFSRGRRLLWESVRELARVAKMAFPVVSPQAAWQMLCVPRSSRWSRSSINCSIVSLRCFLGLFCWHRTATPSVVRVSTPISIGTFSLFGEFVAYELPRYWRASSPSHRLCFDMSPPPWAPRARARSSSGGFSHEFS